MLKKTLTAGLILAVALTLCSAVFVTGYAVGRSAARPALRAPVLTGSPTPESAAPAGEATATPASREALMRPFWEAWDLVHREYVDQPVDDEKLREGAIQGMLAALGDPHTSYMNPLQFKLANSDLAGQLEGIGAEVDVSGTLVKIITPLPGSPAEKAGLLPGDVVLRVDGQDMAGVNGFDVVMKIRGPAGTAVRLTIQREGQAEPLEFEIVRDRITIPSVESYMIGADVAYVKLNNFGDDTGAELEKALQILLALHPRGLVLDLRGNPGGYLPTAIEVASQFIPSGTVMIEQFGDGREQTYTASGRGLATEIPLAVLINAGSASASEIVAGAVQDLRRGALVGETSFGKGSVQNWHALKDDQGAVRVTVARWLTPDRRQISGKGITPDVAVPLGDEDRQAHRDPQLDRAVELLRAGGSP